MNSTSGAKSELERETLKPFDMTSNPNKNSIASYIPFEEFGEDFVSDLAANESPSCLNLLSKHSQYKIGDEVVDERSTFQAFSLFSSTGSSYASETLAIHYILQLLREIV